MMYFSTTFKHIAKSLVTFVSNLLQTHLSLSRLSLDWSGHHLHPFIIASYWTITFFSSLRNEVKQFFQSLLFFFTFASRQNHVNLLLAMVLLINCFCLTCCLLMAFGILKIAQPCYQKARSFFSWPSIKVQDFAMYVVTLFTKAL